MAARQVIRVGLPQPGGRLVAFARQFRLPVLFSANAFAVRDARRRFVRFRLEAARALRDLDAALDSAGFVAAVHYGTYDWEPEQYLDLVEAMKPTFYCAMDYCCEKEIAHSEAQRRLRVVETCRMYGVLARAAEARGLPPPVPVIQGWDASDYRRCIELMPIARWPDLVGVGSVCRRHLTGADGLLAIFDAIDAVLPSHCRVHAFGVKSTALRLLWNHPRFASSDSMAWDAALRRAVPTGRTQELRTSFLLDWLSRQEAAVRDAPTAVGPGTYCAVTGALSAERALMEAVAEVWAELVYTNEVDYLSARAHMESDLAIARGITARRDLDSVIAGDYEDVLPGVGERLALALP